MKIRKGDNVLVIAGKDRGKKGKVRQSAPKHDRLLVEGVNFIKKHAKAVQGARQGGIIEREATNVFGPVEIIDPGDAVAEEVMRRFDVEGSGKTRFLISKDSI